MPSTTQPHSTALLLTLLVITSLTILAGATIAPALPAIRNHFATMPAVDILTRLLLTVPALAIALLAPAAGWFIDRYGCRKILLLSIVLYAAAGTAGLYLDSLVAIIVSRGLLGMAVAGTLTSATTLIGDNFAGAERNRVLGLQSAFVASSGVVFLLAGGALAEIGWRAPFFLYALAIPILPLAISIVRDPTIALSADEAPAPRERVEVRVVLFVVAIYVVSFLFQVAFYMVPVQLPFFLGELGVNDPSRVGAALSTMTLCAAIVAFQFRRIQSVLDRTVILAISLSMLGGGFLLVSRATSFREVIAALVVIGCGAGLNFPNLMSWLMARTPQPVRGRIVGGLTTALFLGQFFSPIASHPFVESGGLSHGYRMMGIFMGVLALIAFVSSVLKPFQSRRSPGS